MASTSEAFKFAKLNGVNYATWAHHMQAALQAKYLWLIVKGSETRPADSAAKAQFGITCSVCGSATPRFSEPLRTWFKHIQMAYM